MRLFASLVLLVSLVLNVVFVARDWERNRVIAVPDGDSIQLKDGRRIRLLGIDAPEKGKCMADAARSRLIALSLGKRIRLKETVKDSYGRLLAIAIVDDIQTRIGYLRWRFFGAELTNDPLLQRALVSEGLARNRLSMSSQYHQVLKDVQEVARSKKLGIWSEECRKSQPVGECVIKGNVRAGKKTYYFPDCPNYSDVIVDEAFGDAWFCSEKEAGASGFTPACGQ